MNGSVQALACPDLFSLLPASSRAAYQEEMLSRVVVPCSSRHC